MLPTAAEVAPWVEAVIRLWDDSQAYAKHQDKVAIEASALGCRYPGDATICVSSKDCARPRRLHLYGPRKVPHPRVGAGAAVLVPYLDRIERECQEGLHELHESA